MQILLYFLEKLFDYLVGVLHNCFLIQVCELQVELLVKLTVEILNLRFKGQTISHAVTVVILCEVYPVSPFIFDAQQSRKEFKRLHWECIQLVQIFGHDCFSIGE